MLEGGIWLGHRRLRLIFGLMTLAVMAMIFFFSAQPGKGEERMMEKLLVAKGFEDAAAFVMEDSLTVAVKKAELTQEDTSKILDLALRCTGLEAQNIKIVPVAPE